MQIRCFNKCALEENKVSCVLILDSLCKTNTKVFEVENGVVGRDENITKNVKRTSWFSDTGEVREANKAYLLQAHESGNALTIHVKYVVRPRKLVFDAVEVDGDSWKVIKVARAHKPDALSHDCSAANGLVESINGVCCF